MIEYDIIKKKEGGYMTNASADKQGNSMKRPLRLRLKYMFSGYKTQNLFTSVCKKAPIYLLALLLISAVIYAFLHPIDKIKLRFFFTRNCTIEVVSKITPHNSNITYPYEGNSKVLIDGDWIEANGKYYNLVDGEVYRYYKDMYGKWQKESYEISTSTSSKLLDKKNYVRDKKNPFVWKLKEEAYEETFSLRNIRIKRFAGCIAITGETDGNGYDAEIILYFRGFGITDIELPWEE